jgi:large subunit ribosomal protein L19
MINKNIAQKIKPGAKVRVWEKIKEGDKERTSRFEGMVLARKHGSEAGATFTVRSVVAGVGVEKVYPIHSPLIDKVEITAEPKRIRRAKLYYVRELSRKATRKKLGVSAD